MVGIDIGTKTIKIVELEKDGTNFSLSASGIVGYSGNSVEKMIDDKDTQSSRFCLPCSATFGALLRLFIDEQDFQLVRVNL